MPPGEYVTARRVLFAEGFCLIASIESRICRVLIAEGKRCEVTPIRGHYGLIINGARPVGWITRFHKHVVLFREVIGRHYRGKNVDIMYSLALTGRC